MKKRRGWRDSAVIVWAFLAVIVAINHMWVPASTWLMIHIVGLGIVTHSIMVWSAYFAAALLKTQTDQATRARQDRRLGLLAFGSLAVFIGMPTFQWWLVLSGAVVVSCMVLWHAQEFMRDLRRALPMRFRIVVRYYIAAALCLPLGVVFGVILARGLGETWHARLLIAHTSLMIFGWVGLAVVGTLVTLWPTVLRARIDPRAQALATWTLPLLVISLGITVWGALFGWRYVAGGGLVAYALALLWWGRTLIRPLDTRMPKEFAPMSMIAAILWFCVAGIAAGWMIFTAHDSELVQFYPTLGAIWVVGFLVQLLTGVMTHLLPRVMGGGPPIIAAAARWLERYAATRLVVINGGLVLWLLPLPPWVAVAVSAAVLAALVMFLPLMVLGIKAAIGQRKAMTQGRTADQAQITLPSVSVTGSGVIAGVGVILLVVTAGIVVDPQGAGVGTQYVSVQKDERMKPTGHTHRVHVDAVGMAYTPSHITVDAGDRVVIELRNADSQNNVHDLQVGQVRTKRLHVGESDTVDLGVLYQQADGWCTVAGHRQLGMTFTVFVR